MSAASTEEVLRRFNQVFLDHDPAPLAGLVDEHCVIENTTPAPDGARTVGRAACVALWTEIATTPGTYFTPEDLIVMGERGIILWRYHRGPAPADSLRGVNLMRVKDGRIVEALGYVKGA